MTKKRDLTSSTGGSGSGSSSSSSSTPKELVGYIYFSSHLGRKAERTGSNSSNECSRSRKRSLFDNGNLQDVILDSWYGFYFVLETGAEGFVSWMQQKEIGAAATLSRQRPILLPLIGPLNILKEVSNAAIHQWKVHIHQYSIIVQNIGNDDEPNPRQQQKPKNTADTNNADGHDEVDSSFLYFLELSSNGITTTHETGRILSQCNNIADSMSSSSTAGGLSAAAMSLHEFQRLEDSEEDITRYNNNHEGSFFFKLPRLSQRQFTIWAIVDAISPILPLKGEPFALIELYQNNFDRDTTCSGVLKEELTCVAVMKGDALLRHSLIQPGQKLIMHNVQRQKWHVPQSFQKKNFTNLHDRAPTHVFVITDPLQVVIETFIPLFNTIRDSVTLEGIIIDIVVHPDTYSTTITRGNIVYYLLDCCTSEVERVNYALFVHHCPMPKSLAYGLRVGTVIRASNVHAIKLWNKVEGYAACIRSSITILECASTKGNNSDSFHIEKSLSLQHTLYKFYLSSGLCSPYEIIWRGKVKQYIGSEIYYTLKKLYNLTVGKKYFLETLFRLILECADQKKQGLCVQSDTPHQRVLNPYAEFFCHAYDTDSGPNSHRYRCVVNCLKMALPAVVSLHDLKNICSSYVVQKIVQISKHCNVMMDVGEPSKTEELTDKVPFAAGLIYTDHLSATWLLRQLYHERQFETNCDLICIGHAEVSRDKNHEVVAVRDSKNRIPLVGPIGNSLQTNDSEQSQNEISSGDLICIKINKIIASVICLGRFSSANNRGSVDRFNLPPAAEEYQEIEKISGACSIFSTGGFVFLVAIHIRISEDNAYSSLSVQHDKSISLKSIKGNKKKISRNRGLSLVDLLSRTQSMHSEVAPIFHAILVRQRFRQKKIEKEIYSGFTVTLGPFPEDAEAEAQHKSSAYNPIQSIDVKVEIDLSNKCTDMMRSSVLAHLNSGVHTVSFLDNGKIALATACWTFADNSNLCAFLAGGWDEREDQSTDLLVETLRPHVAVELCAFQSSYGEWKAKLEGMRCYYESDACFQEQTVYNDRFHIVAGRKFLPGNLARCSKRIAKHSSYMPCELAAAPGQWCGVFDTTIAQLFNLICKDLKDTSCTPLAPSLVWNIRHARLIFLNYCRARVQCTQCYSFLGHNDPYYCDVDISTESDILCSNLSSDHSTNQLYINYCNQPKTVALQNSNSSYVQGPSAQITLKTSLAASCNYTCGSPGRKNTYSFANTQCIKPLQCPNGCPISQASVFWECSGLIDDGSGQAKLYAERDAAKLLLGNSLNVQKIEEGAWRSKDGIWFNNAVPLSPKVANAISKAKFAQGELNRENRSRIAGSSEVLDLMAPIARAQYILYTHCRYSAEPLRRMQFLVRCKATATGSIRRAKIETISSGEFGFGMRPVVTDTATFSLPLLKLQLVDSSLPNTEDESGWGLMHSLTLAYAEQIPP